MLRDLFRKGIDADILHKVFTQFLSNEEIERIITDEISKMSAKEKPLCTQNKSVLRTPRESINFRAQLLFRTQSCASCRGILSYRRRSFLYDKKGTVAKCSVPTTYDFDSTYLYAICCMNLLFCNYPCSSVMISVRL